MHISRLKLLLFLIISVALLCISAIRFIAPLETPTATITTVERAGPSWAYPDPHRTPGVANTDITEANKLETICNPNWSTRSIRPPSSYTSRLKREQMQDLHLQGSASDYEEDHFIPLELGGDPTDPRNLWPEPYHSQPGAREKDAVENYFASNFNCDGKL